MFFFSQVVLPHSGPDTPSGARATPRTWRRRSWVCVPWGSPRAHPALPAHLAAAPATSRNPNGATRHSASTRTANFPSRSSPSCSWATPPTARTVKASKGIKSRLVLSTNYQQAFSGCLRFHHYSRKLLFKYRNCFHRCHNDFTAMERFHGACVLLRFFLYASGQTKYLENIHFLEINRKYNYFLVNIYLILTIACFCSLVSMIIIPDYILCVCTCVSTFPILKMIHADSAGLIWLYLQVFLRFNFNLTSAGRKNGTVQ